MIGLQEALDFILSNSPTPEEETIRLADAAGRILSRPVVAAMHIPPFDRSPLDGYALRAADLADVSPARPLSLNIQGVSRPGDSKIEPLQPGHCMRIATGAPIPPGANAVIPQEKTTAENGRAFFNFSPLPGANVVKAGEDITCGSSVIAAGTRLEGIHLGILASLGQCEVPVFKKPRVAVLSTGNELTHPGQGLLPGKIYDSNTPMLSALVEQHGGIALPSSMSNGTSQEALSAELLRTLSKADAAIVTGGVSVGEEDIVPGAVEQLGAKILFHRIAVKPGTPMLAALLENKYLFCLSGNPAAAYVTFDQLVRPALLAMSGQQIWERPRVKAILEHDLSENNGISRLIRAVCSIKNGVFYVKKAGLERPGVLSSLHEANAFIFRPQGSPGLFAGEEILVQLCALPK